MARSGKPAGRCFGESNGNAKLTAEKVKAIRWSKGKIPQQELADIYNVHRITIYRIHTNKIWTHV